MGKLAKIAPLWQGKPILDPDHAHDLEQRAALHEFQGKLDRKSAEDQAHGDYRREHHQTGAAFHLQGMRAGQASGHMDEAKKHGAMYALHLKALGHDPYGEVPPEIKTRADKEDREKLYRFKAHKSDLFLLDGDDKPSSEKPMQKSESKCPQCKKDSMHVVLGRRECRNCDTEPKARRAMEGASRATSAGPEAKATLKTKKSEKESAMADAENETTPDQKLRKFWDEKHETEAKELKKREALGAIYQSAIQTLQKAAVESGDEELKKYISPYIKYGPTRPKHPAPPAEVPPSATEPKDEEAKKSELCKTCGKAGELCKCMGKSELDKHNCTDCSKPIPAEELKDRPAKMKCGDCEGKTKKSEKSSVNLRKARQDAVHKIFSDNYQPGFVFEEME